MLLKENNMQRENWLQTFNGKYFPLENIQTSAIGMEDISHHLSMLCRFTGAVTRFYSVAEHCCLVADEVYDRTGLADMAMTALLHDAHEAYTGDLNAPVKYLPGMERYRMLGKQIQLHIHAKFSKYCNLTTSCQKLVKKIDMELLATERKLIMLKTDFKWAIDEQNIRPISTIDIEGWMPARAKAEYLRRFHAYRTIIDDDFQAMLKEIKNGK